MADSTSVDTALETLRSTLNNLSTLLSRLRSALDTPATSAPIQTPAFPKSSKELQSSSTSGTSSVTPTRVNPFLLVHTSATLLRAQTTKLSLLSLNKPFTPSALTTTLNLYARIIPSLVSGVQILNDPIYPSFVATQFRNRVIAALTSLAGLLKEVPTSEAHADKVGVGRDGREGQTLKGTGVVWEGCDWLTDMSSKGAAELAKTQIREWGDLVKDAIDEIEEWIEAGENEVDGLADSIEALDMENGSEGGLMEDPPFKEMYRPLAEEVLETLKLVRLVFPPILKRRVARFSRIDKDTKEGDLPDQKISQRLNLMVEQCQELSDGADDIAATLYTGNFEQTKEKLEEIRKKVTACVEGAQKHWDGSDDEFSTWADTMAKVVIPRVSSQN